MGGSWGMGMGMEGVVMVMSGERSIEEVLLLGEMGGEKVMGKDGGGKLMELGMREEWVGVIEKGGYNVVSDMKEVNGEKVDEEICGMKKK